MKKTMILAAFAALISLASCQKEDIISNGTDKSASPVFTASIAGATKTTIDLTNGKVAWEATDEITVTDGASFSAVYTIESIDATTGKATFVIKEGESAIGAGPYTATYGTEPATAQTYSATAGKLYMTAETSTNSFTFTVQCGLMKLNLTKTGESVKSIAVTSSTDATYTLTCDPAQSIATAKDFFIALPAGNYKKIEITNSSDVKATLNSTSGVTVAANHIKPVTFGESKINFAPTVPDGALAGVFSVSATKKVYFSKGNLYADDNKALHFESNQWGMASSGAFDASHVSHFTWSSTVSDAVSKNFVGNYLFCDENNKVSVDGSNAIYYALSYDEWEYLLNTRTVNGGTGAGKSYSFVTYDTFTNGVVLYPDNYTGPSLSNIETLPENVVFLPYAGMRATSGLGRITGGQLFYWTATPHAKNEGYVYNIQQGTDCIDISANSLSKAYSVRLVTDVK